MSFQLRKSMDYGYPTEDYIDTIVMPSGQTVKIEFNGNYNAKKYYFGIYLVVMDKRKNENSTTLKITGRDGLQSLLWAKKKIIEFEEFIKEEIPSVNKNGYKRAPIVIYTFWDDNRRRDIYEHGLKKLGFRYNMVYGKKALCKTI